jgi:hypothetical protein
MANLGDATLELKTDNSDLESGMQDAENSVEGFGVAAGAVMAGFGATIGMVIDDAVDTFTDLGDSIHKMSLRTDLSTEFLGTFNHVLEQNGSSISEFEAGLRKFTMLVGIEMPEQSAKAIEVAELLNLTLKEQEEIMSMDMEEAIMFFLKRLMGIENHFQQASTAMMVFGGAGLRLLPTLKSGEEALHDLIEEAIRFNQDHGKDLIQSAADLNDAFHETEQATNSLKMAMGEALAPALMTTNAVMGDLINKITDFVFEHPKFAQVIGISAVVISGLTVAVGALAVAVKLLGSSLLLAGGIFTGIVLGVTAVVAIFVFWEEIILGLKKTVNVVFEMIGNMIESAINKIAYHINFIIDNVNKLVGIFGKEIPKIPEATIDWSNTFAIETEKIVENTEKQGEAIEETAQKVEQSFRREELALDKKAEAYDFHYDELSQLQQQFDHRTIRQTKKTNEEIKKIFATPDQIRKSMQDRGLTTGLDTTFATDSGRAQFMDSARSGMLQVAATDAMGNALRDEHGGVIFRNATREDASRHQTARDFFGMTDHAVNSLMGADSVNTPIMNSPVSNEQSVTVNLDSKVIDVALMNTIAHERVLE